MTNFGWSYPAGCTSRDVDEALGVEREPHPAEDEIAEILEAAEVDQEVIDKVLEVVAAVCDQLEAHDEPEPPDVPIDADELPPPTERELLRLLLAVCDATVTDAEWNNSANSGGPAAVDAVVAFVRRVGRLAP